MIGAAAIAGSLALGLLAAGSGSVAGAAPQELAVTAHRQSVRLDLARGVPIGGGPRDAEALPLPLRLRAVRDEVVSFQLAVRGTRASTTSVRAVVPPVLLADVLVARGVPLAKPSVSTVARPLGPGLYPDPLVRSASVAIVPAPGVAVVWIDVWVSDEARAGVYEGRVELGGAPAVPFSVEVLELALPRADAARLGAVSFGSIMERRARDRARFLEWMQLAHAHHLTVELMHARASTTASGALDWAGWADDWAPFFDGRAFSRDFGYRGPRAGAPIGRFVIPLSDKWPSPATDRQLPSDPARWSRELKAWEREVERRGWFARPEATEWLVFINSLDEPRHPAMLESLRTFGALIDGAGLVDRGRVQHRIDGPFAQNAEGWSDARIVEDLAPAIDLWCVCGGSPWIPWRLLDARRRWDPRERLMFYASNSAGEPATPSLVLDAELTGARAWGWIVRRYGLAGALNWEVDFRPGCAADPLCSTYGLNADATLIYRGEELGAGMDAPVPSMRLKMLRRGAQDAALLALLEARDPAAAAAIAERIVPEAMGDGHSREGPGAWPVEGRVYDEAREEILDRLLGRAPAVADPSRIHWFAAGLAALVGLAVLRRVRRLASTQRIG